MMHYQEKPTQEEKHSTPRSTSSIRHHIFNQQPFQKLPDLKVKAVGGNQSQISFEQLPSGGISVGYGATLVLALINPWQSILYQALMRDQEEHPYNYSNRISVQINNLRNILREFTEDHQSREKFRDALGDYYAAAANIPLQGVARSRSYFSRKWHDWFGSRLSVSAKNIAHKLARLYFENLEITEKDIKDVIKGELQGKPVSCLDGHVDNLISAIITTRVDRERYELRTLLPSDDAHHAELFKQAISTLRAEASPQEEQKTREEGHVNLRINTHSKKNTAFTVNPRRNPSQSPSEGGTTPYFSYSSGTRMQSPIPGDMDPEAMKRQIIKLLDGYISCWKLSWFGHHHDGRARAVKNAISQCEDVNSIILILNNQHHLLRGGVGGNITRLLGDRWSEQIPGHLKLPNKLESSGYYRIIQSALDIANGHDFRPSPSTTCCRIM